MSGEAERGRDCYKMVTGVHEDDIHGMVVVVGRDRQQKILSGSKDTTVKRFDSEGIFEALLTRNPEGSSYSNWVTAIDAFPDGSFVAGHRNSYLLCRSLSGTQTYFSKKMSKPDESSAKPSAGAGRGSDHGVGKRGERGKFYKKRNETRITAVKTFFDPATSAYQAFIGLPEAFIQLDLVTGAPLRGYHFSKPEWVYGFQLISPVVLLAIHGCALSTFNIERKPTLIKTIVEESGAGAGDRAAQRPFISSVLPMPGDAEEVVVDKVALSFFGGRNEVRDTETGAVIHVGHEHELRVWQAVPYSSHEYATCADDGLVKLWDIRDGESSVKTYSGHPGRVSALAFLRDKKLVAGTCAPNPFEDPDKAQFYFYDLRGGK